MYNFFYIYDTSYFLHPQFGYTVILWKSTFVVVRGMNKIGGDLSINKVFSKKKNQYRIVLMKNYIMS